MATQTIQYQNKVALNTNPEIADINKVTDNDMNEIKSVVNNNATETSNNTTNITNLNTYSASEVNTGKIWIDNKPIYRKVFNFTTASSSVTGWTNIVQISDSLDNVINVYGYTVFGSNKTPIPRYESTDYYLIFLATGNFLRYRCVGFTSANCNLVIEYTKTTD